VRVVAAKPADAAVLTEIALEAKRSWGYPVRWIERWRGALTVTAAYIRGNPTFAAARNGEIVGFCSVMLAGAEARLDHLWVRPAAARRGVGRLLFRHCERVARKGGATRLWVESDPNAEGFYRSMGAETVGHNPAPIGGTERVLPVLEKNLRRRTRSPG
jgi:ribosomal protein S18 acetylase RimI-like enzyme